MLDSAVDISLPKLGRCLRVHNASDVVEALAQVMPAWPMTVEPAQGATPTSYIYRDAEGLWQGSLDQPNEFELPTTTGVACSLVGELVGRRLEAEPELLGLHCGSVEINNSLVVFPESSKAGKSTLTVAFAAAGYRVFGDDVLGLTAQGEGVAMGVAPRLRLPLPDSFCAEFIDYAERYAGPEDDCYRFVIPAVNRLADYAAVSPVGAIVLLERHPHIVEPEVVRLAPGEGLLQLLSQNFADSDTPDEELIERLLPLIQRVPCLMLRYSEPLAGARYLAKAIENPHLQRANSASLLNYMPASVDDAASYDLDRIWLPAEGVSSYALGEELFLIHPATGDIYRLNASGKIAWQLLQHEPVSGHALSDVIAAYFSVPLNAVTADLSVLLRALSQADLIVSPASQN